MLSVLVLSGCNAQQRRTLGESARGSSAVGGRVVSTVDGHAITVGEVEALVRAGLSPREALRRLQAERLLMAEAERLGFGKTAAASQVATQARVQALLEAEADAVRVSDAEIRAAYERSKDRFEKPERRASVHVLAKLPKDASAEADAAARAFIERVIPELRDARDLDAFKQQQAARSTPEFKVVSERLPAVGRHERLVEPFLAALFSVAGPSVVPEPVRTSYGWHAIRVTEILPAVSTPYDKAAEQLRAELLTQKRKARIDELIAQLRQNYGVQIDDHAAQTLAALAL